MRCCGHALPLSFVPNSHKQQQHRFSLERFFFCVVTFFIVNFMWAAQGAAHAGAARRRRERRHRAYMKYVRMSVAMALSEYKHHTSIGQRMDTAGGWEREAPHGHVPEQPTLPPPAAGTEYFSLDVEDVTAAGSRPGPVVDPRPQHTVLQHAVTPSAPSCRFSTPLCRRRESSWCTSSRFLTRSFPSSRVLMWQRSQTTSSSRVLVDRDLRHSTDCGTVGGSADDRILFLAAAYRQHSSSARVVGAQVWWSPRTELFSVFRTDH